MKAKCLLLAFSMLYPLGCFADYVGMWNYENESSVSLRTENRETTYVRSAVRFGDDGGKYVYFALAYYDLDKDETSYTDFCKPDGFNDRGVIRLNGQAVKVLRWCIPFDKGGHYLQLTALTKRGEDFVLSLLSKASDNVILEVDGVNYEISADGFTAVWNKSSDNAI